MTKRQLLSLEEAELLYSLGACVKVDHPTWRECRGTPMPYNVNWNEHFKVYHQDTYELFVEESEDGD